MKGDKLPTTTLCNLTSGLGNAVVLSTAIPGVPMNSAANREHVKKKRKLPGTPDPEAEVIALSPDTLMATNRFVCEICNKGFQRDQNLQLHRRGHNLPWKLRQRSSKEIQKRVYICPEETCVHHDPSRALGDLTGIKKHFCRKHGEKKWKCDNCSKKYAVHSDYKAHSKTCGTRELRCECGDVSTRRDAYVAHKAFCEYRNEASVRDLNAGGPSMANDLSHRDVGESGLSTFPAQWGHSGGHGDVSTLRGYGMQPSSWPQFNLQGNSEMNSVDLSSPYLMQSANMQQHGLGVSNMLGALNDYSIPQVARDFGMMHPVQGNIYANFSSSKHELPGTISSSGPGEIGGNMGMGGGISSGSAFVVPGGGSRIAHDTFERTETRAQEISQGSNINLQQHTSTLQMSATTLLQTGRELARGDEGSLDAIGQGPNTKEQSRTSAMSLLRNSNMMRRPEHQSLGYQGVGTTLQPTGFGSVGSGQVTKFEHGEFTIPSPQFNTDIYSVSSMYPGSTIASSSPVYHHMRGMSPSSYPAYHLIQQGNEVVGPEQQHQLGVSQGQQRTVVGEVDDAMFTRDFLGVQAGRTLSKQDLEDFKLP